MTSRVEHINGQTFHGRKGALENAFRYSVDYVLLDAEAVVKTPLLFARNRRGLVSLHDDDHGGAPKAGRGATWVREVLTQAEAPFAIGRIELLAQPRVLGHVFNPVSFWLIYDEGNALRTVIPEVTNTYGDRHSYLCHHDDWREIDREDTLTSEKCLHVSPFQPVEGGYTFRFDIRPDKIGVWIDYTAGNGGLLATLTGPRAPLTSKALVRALVRRPLGSRRVLGLIHWQALKLWWKGAAFRSRPEPPVKEVSR
ncbi:DUF1365 domain-containing protein [Boseongicola aestuarii]|uniref:Cyclopropane-fatty-acyl-phospholipid synthase n=1 Tax=Boseongicola aestuarii TaxID=1470561 RepID=A0A238IXB0_9RHOB|nr:DUF1365 domain-containing protein [Boseongicola aestuarii]SMX23109.1 hypothetical protein BOA8489_01211 [Boseongicola aestuarii]